MGANHMQLLDNNRISGDTPQTSWMLQLQSGFMSLRRENLELRNEISAMTLSMERGFQIVNSNVRRVALQPAQRCDTTSMVRTVTMTDATAAAALAPAMVKELPKTLSRLVSELCLLPPLQ